LKEIAEEKGIDLEGGSKHIKWVIDQAHMKKLIDLGIQIQESRSKKKVMEEIEAIEPENQEGVKLDATMKAKPEEKKKKKK
jgi:hypothetical protein